MKYIMLILLCVSVKSNAQQVYSFNQLDSLQKIKHKNVFVFVHTDWCNYCKAMEEKVFKDPVIINLLTEQFYFVKLDAEEKENLIYANRVFKFKPSLGFHELATLLSGDSKNSLVFPSSYIINTKDEIISHINGFINSADLQKQLKFYALKN